MTSVLDVETTFLWFYDHPDLMARFRDILAAKMVELNILLRAFSGNTQPGWWITDDNCALFNRKLYLEYCVPVLERVLDAMAPGDAWELNTTGIPPCGYVVHVRVWDRTIRGSTWGHHNHSNDQKGFCLLKEP